MEIHLKKNEAAEIMFPMVDSATPANLKSGVSPVDTAYYQDGGGWTSLAITDTATEIGSTGMYTIDLTAAEMNHDKIMIKFAVSGAADTVVIIRTYARDVDDIAYPATSGRSLDVDASGKVVLQGVTHTGAVIPTVSALTGHTAQSGDTYGQLPTNFSSLSISAGGLVDILQTAADKVWSSATRTLTSLGSSLVSEIWDALLSGMITVGSVGEKLSDWVLGTDNKALISTDAQDLSASLDVNTKTLETGLDLTATMKASVNTEVDNALDTAIPGTPTADSVNERIKAIDDKLPTGNISDLQQSEVLSDATPFAGANVDAAVSTRATPAQVNSEVLDVLNTDTFGEPGQGAPPETTTIFTKINYLYKFLRNKITNDGTDIKVYNDAGAVVDHKAGVSEAGGTVTRDEFISGP